MTGSAPRRFLEPRLFATDAAPEPGTLLQLQASHCATCDRWEFPALSYCPTCKSAVEDRPLSELGRIGGLTAVLHAPPDVLIEVPYAVALVEFPEGLSILGTVPGVPLSQLRVGDAVTTVATTVGADIGYGFQPCDPPDA